MPTFPSQMFVNLDLFEIIGMGVDDIFFLSRLRNSWKSKEVIIIQIYPRENLDTYVKYFLDLVKRRGKHFTFYKSATQMIRSMFTKYVKLN